MKLFATIVILIAFPFHSRAQLADRGPTREQLKGYKKITSRTYSTHADSAFISVSFVNGLGDITKTESYDKSGLVVLTKYEYDVDGLLKYEEEHGRVFEYDEQVKGPVGKIRDDHYNAKMFEYKDKLLTREVWIQAGEGYKNYDYVITYEYDKSGRLTKEVHTNKYTGPVVTFKPGTAIADSSFNKNEVSQWTKISSYKSDTVIVTSYDENKIADGSSIIKMSPTKKPISNLSLDKFGEPIEVSSMIYDKNDNLIRQTNRVIDIDKINYDRMGGDEIEFVYNERSLTILRVVKEKEKMILTTEITYD